MNIIWYGQSCFKIQTRPQRGAEEITIITDPFSKEVGLRPFQGSANIVTVSHSHYDHNDTSSIKGEPFVIDSAGEYSVSGVTVVGIESFHDDKKGTERGRNTIFTIETEDIKICHLGDLGHVLEEKQLDYIGEVDIVMVPVGGKYTISASQAEKVVAKLEPKMIIPMHYKLPELSIDLDTEEPFIKELGAKVDEKTFKLSLKKADLDEMEGKLVVMKVG